MFVILALWLILPRWESKTSEYYVDELENDVSHIILKTCVSLIFCILFSFCNSVNVLIELYVNHPLNFFFSCNGIFLYVQIIRFFFFFWIFFSSYLKKYFKVRITRQLQTEKHLHDLIVLWDNIYFFKYLSFSTLSFSFYLRLYFFNEPNEISTFQCFQLFHAKLFIHTIKNKIWQKIII